MSSPVNEVKAVNAILHIAQKMEDCGTYGSVVLNKILYYADHLQYRDTGRKITDFDYVRQLRGPTPSPKQYMKVKNALIENEAAEEIVRDYFGKPQKRLIALKEADYSVFSATEMANLDTAILMFRSVNGRDASELSHVHELGWQLADQWEEIPPSTFLLMEEEPTEADVAWGQNAFDEFLTASSRHN